MRATFLAGGPRSRRRTATRRPQHRPRADGRVPARHPRAAAEPGPGAARHPRGPGRRTSRSRSSGSTTSTASSSRPRGTIDGLTDDPSAARRSWRRCSTRRTAALPGRRCCWPAGDNVGASPPNSALLQDTPDDRRRERVGARRHRASATTSSTTASRGSSTHEARAHFPFLSANIVDDDHRARRRTGSQPSAVFRVNGDQGRRDRRDRARRRPSSSSAGATAGPDVPPRGRSGSRPSPSGCGARA